MTWDAIVALLACFSLLLLRWTHWRQIPILCIHKIYIYSGLYRMYSKLISIFDLSKYFIRNMLKLKQIILKMKIAYALDTAKYYLRDDQIWFERDATLLLLPEDLHQSLLLKYEIIDFWCTSTRKTLIIFDSIYQSIPIYLIPNQYLSKFG